MYRSQRFLIALLGAAALGAPVSGTVSTSSAAPPAPAPQVTTLRLDGVPPTSTASPTSAASPRSAASPTSTAGRVAQGGAGPGYARATMSTGSGHRISVSGPRGSTAVITQTRSADGRDGAAELVIRTPDVKALGADPAATARAYRDSGRSVVVEAMAAGIPYEQAVAEFGDMDPDSVPTKGEALAVLAPVGVTTPMGASVSPSLRQARTAPGVTVAPSILKTGGRPAPYDSACADIYFNARQYSHACDVRYLDYARNGQWYLSHKMKVSAAYDSFWSALNSASVSVVYGSGGRGNGGKGTFWADFDPYSREPIGRCGTWTAGVQDPKTGANISYSGTVCPSSIGPVWSARAQGTYKGYGATWHGLSSSAKGAVAAGVVNNPPGSTASRTVRTRFSWTLK